jgi:hypothetical protein
MAVPRSYVKGDTTANTCITKAFQAPSFAARGEGQKSDFFTIAIKISYFTAFQYNNLNMVVDPCTVITNDTMLQ